MADMSNVDSDKIVSTVNQLNDIAESIRNQRYKIVEAVQALDKGWVSPVKAEFMSRFERDNDAMGEMLDQYTEVSWQLKLTAEDFDKTESEILSSFSTLK